MAALFIMNRDNNDFLNEKKEAYEVFDIDASDHDITSTLRNRIAKSEKFYQEDPQYKIKKTRDNNKKMLWGNHYGASWYPSLLNSSIKYEEPEIYVGLQSIIAYLTSRIHEVEARPFNDSVQAKFIAEDFAKFAQAHGVEFNIINLMVRMLFSLMTDRVGVIKMTWDPNYRGIGEIIPKHIDPSRIVFDHTAGTEDNPGFIAEKVDATVQQLIQRFPEKKQAIFDHLNIKKGTAKQMADRHDYYEVWMTGADKDGNEEEQLVCFMGGLVLLKTRNPHFLYDIEADTIGNYLPSPPKPYITINLLNDGSNKLDQTSLIEMVGSLQHALNRRKRTIAEQAERYAGLKVWSGSAVDKEDVEDLSGEPDESIVVDADDVRTAVNKIAPDFLPQFIYEDALDIRNTIHSILGTPPALRGDDPNTETLGEAIMQRDQAAGRMETLVRALDHSMDRYYKMLYHFVKVYYTEEHWKALAGENGTFEYVMMQRDRLEDGLDVGIKNGTSLPLDDAQMGNIAVKLASMDRISTSDLYQLLKLPNASKMYENYIKDKIDPTLLVKDVKTDVGDRTAYMDYEVIKAGKDAPPREDIEAGHINTHREQMVSDDFQNWPADRKRALISHVEAEIESLTRRAIAKEGQLNARAAADQQTAAAESAGIVPPPMEPGAATPPPEGQPPMPGQPPMDQPPAPTPNDVAATPENPVPMLPPQ